MKNNEHPEFQLLNKLKRLQAKAPKSADLDEVIQQTEDIVNENVISIVQMAHLYVFLSEPGNLRPDTIKKLRELFTAALNCIPALSGEEITRTKTE